MGVAFADYDGDGLTDIFVANDTVRNFLFRNKGDGTFTELGVMAGVAFNQNGKSIAGMGVDFRDVDNDGLPDVFVTGTVNDTFPLYRNGGRGFEDVTSRTGVARATGRVTGWSAGIFDFDNDGRKDLYAALGAILDNSMEVQNLPAKLPNMILHNQGARFSNAGAEAGPDFNQKRMHRGAAFGDLNNDGRVDIVTSSLNEPAEILLNESPEANHWLLLKLKGRQSNRDGIGAKVRIEPEGGVAQVQSRNDGRRSKFLERPACSFRIGRGEAGQDYRDRLAERQEAASGKCRRRSDPPSCGGSEVNALAAVVLFAAVQTLAGGADLQGAIAKFQAGDCNGVIAILSRDKTPDPAEGDAPYAMLAACYLQLGRVAEGMKAVRNGLVALPQSGLLKRMLGQQLFREDPHNPEVGELLEGAMTALPGDPESRHYFAAVGLHE